MLFAPICRCRFIRRFRRAAMPRAAIFTMPARCATCDAADGCLRCRWCYTLRHWLWCQPIIDIRDDAITRRALRFIDAFSDAIALSLSPMPPHAYWCHFSFFAIDYITCCCFHYFRHLPLTILLRADAADCRAARILFSLYWFHYYFHFHADCFISCCDMPLLDDAMLLMITRHIDVISHWCCRLLMRFFAYYGAPHYERAIFSLYDAFMMTMLALRWYALRFHYAIAELHYALTCLRHYAAYEIAPLLIILITIILC